MFWAFSLAWLGVAPLHRLAVGRVAWGDHWLLAQRDAVTTAQLLVLLSLAAFLAGAALPVRAAAPGTTRLDPARTVRAAGVVIAFAVLLLPLAARAGGGFASLGVYDEANNSENLRLTWQQAIDGGADWGQLVTWNDYAEGTQFAPSVHSGRSLLDLTAFHAQWFRSGAAPRIVRDTLYLSHRVHAADAEPTGGQTELMELREDSSPARDEVEVLAFLTAPAEVVIEVDGRRTRERLPAGVSATRAPLDTGAAAAPRDGAVVATVRSPWEVTADPQVQDLGYRYTAGAGGAPYGPGPARPGRSTSRCPPDLPVLARC